MDVGLLLIRLVVGLLFVGHGSQKLFGWFGGGGPNGTGQFFEKIGYRPGRTMALVGGGSELAGGALLVLGFLTPLAALLIAGMMASAIFTVHLPNGLWNTNGGVEFPLVLLVTAVALALAGPGTISVDQALGWHLWGTVWGLAVAFVGIAGAWIVSPRRAKASDEAVEKEAGPNERAA